MTKKKVTTAELLRKLGYSVEELKKLKKEFTEREEREKILMVQFQWISDVEIIQELKKRVSQQDIKLSVYPHQEHIFIAAQDITKQVSFPLPIEINEKDQ